MFFGWFSSDSGGTRSGGGCIFLPFLLFFGLFYLLDNFNSGWLLAVAAVALLWWGLPRLLNGEKAKRGLDDKAKRDSRMVLTDDGEIVEVSDPPSTAQQGGEGEAR